MYSYFVSGENDTISIEIVALVINYENNVNLASVTTTAVFSSTTVTVTSRAIVRIVTPSLTVEKFSFAPSYLAAGSVVNFTIAIHHNAYSNAAAYNNSLYDALHSNLILIPNSVQTSNGVITTGSQPGERTIRITFDTIPLDTVVTVTYSATISTEARTNSVLAGQVTVWWASAAEDDNNEGEIRYYDSFTSASVRLTAPALTLTLYNTSLTETQGSQVTIGELVYLFANLTIIPGTTNTAVITIKMPPLTVGEIVALSGEIKYLPSNIDSTAGITEGQILIPTDNDENGNADTFVVDFGDIINHNPNVQFAPNVTLDQISISIVGRIVDNDQNQNMKAITSTAACAYSNTFDNYTVSSDLSLTIVEPFLNVAKSVTAYAYPFVEAGNTVAYSLLVTHSTTSKSAAFNIDVSDSLSSLLLLVPDSIKTRTGTVDYVSNTTVLVHPATYPIIMNPLLVISYNATITYLAPVSTQVPNTVVISWSSAPTDGRLYSNFGQTTVTMASPTVGFARSSTSLSQTANADVAIGETIKYIVTIVLPQGTIKDATVVVTFPQNPGNGIFYFIFIVCFFLLLIHSRRLFECYQWKSVGDVSPFTSFLGTRI